MVTLYSTLKSLSIKHINKLILVRNSILSFNTKYIICIIEFNSIFNKSIKRKLQLLLFSYKMFKLQHGDSRNKRKAEDIWRIETPDKHGSIKNKEHVPF